MGVSVKEAYAYQLKQEKEKAYLIKDAQVKLEQQEALHK